MSVLAAVALGLAMGIVFGLALEKSRVFEPGVIVGQMRLANFTMLKVFLSAVATGLVLLAALHGLGLTKLHPKATLWAADIVGGLLLGAGITITGACPGTVLAQIGVGYRDARITLAGCLLGALAFTYAEPTLRPLLRLGDEGKLTLDAMVGLPFWTVALTLAATLVLTLVALERWRPWQEELGDRYDGVIPEERQMTAPMPRTPTPYRA